MPNVSGGVLVARMLKAEGIEYIFSLVGGHIYPIYDACVEEGIKVIDVRHEAAAAHMAEGIALVTGKPGVCLVTAGPGFTNVITGIANAQAAQYYAYQDAALFLNSIPVQCRTWNRSRS